ncbi:murein transglycosylase A [Sphingomonas sp. ID0503]|uniref:murein transglycosylase A n=1 Tax=Sphingomonas sp. ID0503 TaxID=3399691 RepID=UPI003AFB6EA0
MRSVAAAFAALLLAGCVGRAVPPPTVAVAPAPPPVAVTPPKPIAPPTTAVALGVKAGPSLASFDLEPIRAAPALRAFRLTCPALMRREDSSGLTRRGDWDSVCSAAKAWPDGDAPAFFSSHFRPVVVGEGRAFATGYYEPEIAGSKEKAPGYDTPVYARPDDLIEADLGQFSPDLKGRRIRGKVKDGKLIPYPDRKAIDEGALKGKKLEIGYAADPIEFFFLQIQGSGRLRLADGSIMRIGYDGQNGREYVGIGSLMKKRGLFQPGQAQSMQGIMAWLRANPEQGRALMNENKSFVFFKVLTGAGPLGAMNQPVAGRVSCAVDPKFVPLGAPVWLAVDRVEATGLWVAQDTGGAIKGANRFDTFWGAGTYARVLAGGMSGRGQAYILLPKAAAERLTGAGAAHGGATARS